MKCEQINCEGYKKLLASVESSESKWPNFHNYRAKLQWALDRAKHYSEKTGVSVETILDAWEKRREYWFMNYYQDANQPLIKDSNVRVFSSQSDAQNAVGTDGFRCPACGGKSNSPYECDSKVVTNGKPCDWKVYGLFRDLGKGVTVIAKDTMQMERIFMPIAWELEAVK